MYHDWGFVWKLNDVEEVCAQWLRGSEARGSVEKSLLIGSSSELSSKGGFFSIQVTGLPTEIQVASMHRHS
jgi:hypothetical protein